MYGEAELLGYALVDEVAAAVDGPWDRTWLGRVEVGDLLSECLLEIMET